MSIGATPRTTNVALTNTAATTVLAGPGATLNRYLKHIKVVNGGAAGTYNLGFKATTTAPAAGDLGLIALAAPIGANSSIDHLWYGDGSLWTNASGLNLNGSASAATQMNVHIIYLETAL